MRPSLKEYLTPRWVSFTLTIPGQNYIDAHIGDTYTVTLEPSPKSHPTALCEV